MSDKTSFFEELKRRNVVRVGVVYLIVAWLLAQVSDLMLGNFEAPGWVIKVILLMLIIGFPLAVIFAWAFEMTPEGIKKEKDVDRSQSITLVTGRKLDFAIIGVLVVALGYFAWDKFGTENGSETALVGGRSAADSGAERAPAEPEAATNEKSIAVLPFVNMSSDPEQEFFSDGISEEILNALAKVKELKVAGRTSSFAFKGQNQDLRKIGGALNVSHILEGSVRKSGTKVRITAQLIQVEDGFHLWSETYDRELTDVFAIQDEISGAILEQLKAALVGAEAAPVSAAARTNSEVYDLYLLARQHIYERNRASIESAGELLDQAIAQDPAYAPAYAQRGIVALMLSERNYGDVSLAESSSQGKLYLDKALQLDPDLAEAYAGMGLYHLNRPTESGQAIASLEKALSINPNLIDASNWLQTAYQSSGEPTRALKILEGMVERDPLYRPGVLNTISIYNQFGLQDKSWALLDRLRPLLPNDFSLLLGEADTWMSLGKGSKALPLLESLLERRPSDGVIRINLGIALLMTGQLERVIEEGVPPQQAIALSALGRQEEASMIVNKLAEEGDVGWLIDQLGRTGQADQLVAFVESHWPDLTAFESQYPDGPGIFFSRMLYIATAYSRVGNEKRFDEAMAHARAVQDRAIARGFEDLFFLVDEARFLALSGDPEGAKAQLAKMVDKGMLIGIPFSRLWPELGVLSGDPEFEAIQARMFEHLNAERAELGLEPLST